jgi:flagellar basal-body rod protein FlgB
LEAEAVIGNDFSRTIDILQRAMDASLIRRDVIANNMANSDVPNFKRTVVNFESELKRALDSEKEKPALSLSLTNEKHIPNWRERDYRDVEPRRVLDYLSTAKNNGNNVDPEEEMMLSLQNQLSYTLLAQAQTFEFGQVNLVLR